MRASPETKGLTSLRYVYQLLLVVIKRFKPEFNSKDDKSETRSVNT